jgi:hypothetical protein
MRSIDLFGHLFFLLHHFDGLRWTLLRTYTASLAVIEVNFHGYGSFHDTVRAIQPADEAGRPLILHWRALRLINFGPRVAPVSRFPGFPPANLGMCVGVLVVLWVLHLIFLRHGS